MPTALQQAVQSTLSSFLQQRLASDYADIAQDVYRTLRDEAHLLLERQLICDALDSDPFELMRVSSSGGNSCYDDDGNDAEDCCKSGQCDSGGGKEDVHVADEDELLEKRKNREVIARVKVRKQHYYPKKSLVQYLSASYDVNDLYYWLQIL